jgi:hypothetical protein
MIENMKKIADESNEIISQEKNDLIKLKEDTMSDISFFSKLKDKLSYLKNSLSQSPLIDKKEKQEDIKEIVNSLHQEKELLLEKEFSEKKLFYENKKQLSVLQKEVKTPNYYAEYAKKGVAQMSKSLAASTIYQDLADSGKDNSIVARWI